MRILHLITRLDRGGSADNTLYSCMGQIRAGHEVTLAVGPGITEESPLLEEAEALGVQTVRIPSLVRSLRPLSDLSALWACFRLIRKGGFDLVHTHTSKAGILGRLAARLANGCAVVHTPHGHIFYGYFGPAVTRLFIWAERLAARWTDAIITLTRLEEEEHLAVGIGRPELFTRIFSGIPLPKSGAPRSPEERSERRRSLGLPAECLLIGSIGRLDPIKGHEHLLRAFARILPRHPEARLILVGDGELRAHCEALARELGIAENTFFPGWQNAAVRYLEAMDIFVLPSLNEGMSRAVVEAMAAGVAVIASRVGGVPELIEEERNGLLVPPADPVALAGAMERLLADRELRERMGCEGLRQTSEYSVEKMIDRIEALYMKIRPSAAKKGSPA
ncbi:MAG: glycosyltransferase family 4 protein [bacterium]|nr:glycosyltransferase family 4 protein [bacterium]